MCLCCRLVKRVKSFVRSFVVLIGFCVSMQAASPAPHTAARPWCATARTSDPPPSPSSPSPSTTSSPPSLRSPSPCSPSSLACRPAPVPALVPVLGVRRRRRATTCSRCRGLRAHRRLLLGPFGLHPLGATLRFASRGRPAPEPAPPAPPALSPPTAAPAPFPPACASRRSRARVRRRRHVLLRLHPWG